MVQPKDYYKDVELYAIPRVRPDISLKLDANENTLGCSPVVLDALSKASYKDISQYPAYGNIEKKIAEFNNVPENYVMITNGGDASVKALFFSYIKEGDEVLFASPSYSMYKINVALANAKLISVPYEEKWRYPTRQIINRISENTKMIIICSPNNPTGDIIPEKDLIEILEAAPNAVVLLDEAYYRFSKTNPKGLLHLVNTYKNLIVLRTFSKDFGLAGMRVAYSVAQPYLMDNIRKALDPFPVTNLSIIAAEAALQDQQYVDDYISRVHQAKDQTFSAIKPYVDEIYDTETNFLWINLNSKQEWVFHKLLKNNIKVRRFSSPETNGFIRLTIGTPEQMKEVVSQFKPYDMVVFDVDGVLIDESLSYRNAIRETYAYFTSKDITLEEIQGYKNQGGFNNDWKLTKHLLDEAGLNISMDDIIEKFQEIYFNDGKGLIKEEKLLVKKETIEALSKQYKLTVFTGRPKEEVIFALENNDILKYFDMIVSMDDVSKGKPDCEGLEKISKRYNTTNMLFIGDMPDDIIAAETFKIDSVGVLPPQDKSDALKELLLNKGAIYVYNDGQSALEAIFGIK